MAISKQRKEALVSTYVELLKKSNGFVIINVTNMKVADVNLLRAEIRKEKGLFYVTKNTLISKALEQAGWPIPADHLTGPSAIVFGLENFPGVAKAVLNFVADKDATKISVRGGAMTEQVLSAKQVDAISKLPSLDELRAQLAGLVVAPATGIVSVIQAANSSIVNVIQAYLDDRQEKNTETATEDGAA